jgi:hypothetical protein
VFVCRVVLKLIMLELRGLEKRWEEAYTSVTSSLWLSTYWTIGLPNCLVSLVS